MQKLQSWLFYILPHHLISRVIFLLTRVPAPLCYWPMRWFIKAFGVNMQEAEYENINHYKNFNQFFTRALKADARPIDAEPDSLCSPVDGHFSQVGMINDGTIIQAKQHDYSCADLLASEESAEKYQHGSFANIYLSPRDYHRIHMPYDAELISTTYVPGRLFSVAPSVVENIPRLFARNERVICEFTSQHGHLAMVLVGAINVAAIETVWHGLITPPRKSGIKTLATTQTVVSKGQEIARFNMGSTVILLSEKTINFSAGREATQPIQMGQPLGKFIL